jgi:hypothetical protein
VQELLPACLAAAAADRRHLVADPPPRREDEPPPAAWLGGFSRDWRRGGFREGSARISPRRHSYASSSQSLSLSQSHAAQQDSRDVALTFILTVTFTRCPSAGPPKALSLSEQGPGGGKSRRRKVQELLPACLPACLPGVCRPSSSRGRPSSSPRRRSAACRSAAARRRPPDRAPASSGGPRDATRRARKSGAPPACCARRARARRRRRRRRRPRSCCGRSSGEGLPRRRGGSRRGASPQPAARPRPRLLAGPCRRPRPGFAAGAGAPAGLRRRGPPRKKWGEPAGREGERNAPSCNGKCAFAGVIVVRVGRDTGIQALRPSPLLTVIEPRSMAQRRQEDDRRDEAS